MLFRSVLDIENWPRRRSGDGVRKALLKIFPLVQGSVRRTECASGCATALHRAAGTHGATAWPGGASRHAIVRKIASRSAAKCAGGDAICAAGAADVPV